MAERMTERIICGPCNGTGYFSEQGKDCGTCKSLGYLENPSGGESVCPTCNGNGYGMKIRICRECNGKGYRVCIYEITDYTQPCGRCAGTGNLMQEYVYYGRQSNLISQYKIECPICHGRGNICAQRIRRIK